VITKNASYIIIERETAQRVQRMASWMAAMLADQGPSWRRHEQDLRLASASLQDAIDRSQRASDAASVARSEAA
jgi:hypothetical protein